MYNTYIVQRSLKFTGLYQDRVSKRNLEEGCGRSEEEQPQGKPRSVWTRKKPHLASCANNSHARISGEVRTRGAPRRAI